MDGRAGAWADAALSCVQGTKPHSLVALDDSPAGLLCYIVEKLSTWTDSGGDPVGGRPERALARIDMVTNVAIYWSVRCAGDRLTYLLPCVLGSSKVPAKRFWQHGKVLNGTRPRSMDDAVARDRSCRAFSVSCRSGPDASPQRADDLDLDRP